MNASFILAPNYTYSHGLELHLVLETTLTTHADGRRSHKLYDYKLDKRVLYLRRKHYIYIVK